MKNRKTRLMGSSSYLHRLLRRVFGRQKHHVIPANRVVDTDVVRVEEFIEEML